MSELSADDPHSRRQSFGDIRDDYDDEFGRVLTPHEEARRRVRIPGTAFVVIGSIGIAGLVVGEIALVADNLPKALAGRSHHVVTLLLGSIAIVTGIAAFAVVIVGGVNMCRLRRRWLAMVAAYVVTATTAAGCYAIFLYPFGIWALIVLYQPDVRREFGRPPPPRDEHHD